jgi:hypothetical protein
MKLSAYSNQALSNSSASQPFDGIYLFHRIFNKFFPSVYFFAINLPIAKANIAGIQSGLYFNSCESNYIESSMAYFY